MPDGEQGVELAAKDVEVRVKVRRAATLRGHVEPRQVCDVAAESEQPRAAAGFAPITTGADGEFAFTPADTIPYMLTARCPTGDQGTLLVHATLGLADQILRVAPGASIAGHVVDAAGNPVAGATVMAAPQEHGDRTTIVNGVVTSGVQAITTATGAYEVRGLGATTYDMTALDRGRPMPMKGEVRVVLDAAEHKTGVDLAVERADGVIRGTVSDGDGKPLADAWVSVHQEIGDLLAAMPHSDTTSRMVTVENTSDGADEPAPVLTDATGHFELDGLPRVPWTVVAEAQAGALRGRASAVKPDATIAIRALGVTSLAGTAHAPAPLSAFEVELDGPTRTARGFASPDGTFAFDRVDPGHYAVRVTSSAGNGEATADVVAGQPAQVDVTLAANAIVVGRLVDPNGQPLAGMPVTTVADPGDGHLQISLDGPPPTSAGDGSFRLEAKAGNAMLVVMRQPAPFVKRGLVLVGGQTLDLGTVIVDAKQQQHTKQS